MYAADPQNPKPGSSYVNLEGNLMVFDGHAWCDLGPDNNTVEVAAAELRAIAEEMESYGIRSANDDLIEYGEYDYRGWDSAMKLRADRIRAVAAAIDPKEE